MIGRRAILKAFAGAAALGSAAPRISAGAVSALAAGSSGVDQVGFGDADCSPMHNPLEPAFRALHNARNRQTIQMRYTDFDIACKKSWSTAFKAHVQHKRNVEYDMLQERLHRDKAFRTKVLEMLGVPHEA